MQFIFDYVNGIVPKTKIKYKQAFTPEHMGSRELMKQEWIEMKLMGNNTFERIEKKFWMNEQQCKQMESVLLEHMEVDQYGRTTIHNVYCDTDDYYLTRKSIEGPYFKEKLRIRSYSGFDDDAIVFVEIKRKLNGIGYKRRLEIPLSQLDDLMSGRKINTENTQIEKELNEFVNRYHPNPKVYLTYERVAMFEKGQNGHTDHMAHMEDQGLRITLDRNIRYRIFTERADLTRATSPVMDDESMVLMEVKAPGCMPEWLISEMSRLKIYHTSFSKIGTCYTKFIAPRLEFSARPEYNSMSYKETRKGSTALAGMIRA